MRDGERSAGGGKREERHRAGKESAGRRENLNDVGKSYILREREREGKGGREREDRLLTSALQYTSVLPRRERKHIMTD